MSHHGKAPSGHLGTAPDRGAAISPAHWPDLGYGRAISAPAGPGAAGSRLHPDRSRTYPQLVSALGQKGER